MSNVDVASQFFTAINFDRFAEIEAFHAPDVVFHSFRGPTLRDAVATGDWHRVFQRDYADCNYSEVEFIEAGDVVCARVTIEAKGYDWRAFTQRVVEVLRIESGEIAERRLYGMLRDVEFDKPVNAAMDNALGYRGGSPAETGKTAAAAVTALLAGDRAAAAEHLAEKAVLIDGVYGLAAGAENVAGLFAAAPRPLFGVPAVTHAYAGEHTALVEVAIDPSRPRAAYWVRLVDGKVLVIEAYWMLREMGVNPDVNYAHDRHRRQVILPT
jgi:ketosteroid isomerase-like protein